jgi:hypothetical protein
VVTVTSGYIVETHTSHQTLTGWLLVLMNISIVGVAVQVQRSERLHTLIDCFSSHHPPSAFDPALFAELWVGANRAPLALAILEAAKNCVGAVAKTAKGVPCDQHWEYFVSMLLPLKDGDERLIWEEQVPQSVDWYAFVEDAVTLNLESLKRDLEMALVPIKQGWLQKRGYVNSAWRRRFFVLGRVPSGEPQTPPGVVLFYFASEGAAESFLEHGYETQKGSIDLASVLAVRAKGPDRILEVATSERTWILSAEHREDFEAWSECLGGTDAFARLSKGAKTDTTRTSFRNAAKRLLGSLYEYHAEAVGPLFEELLLVDHPKADDDAPPRISSSAHSDLENFGYFERGDASTDNPMRNSEVEISNMGANPIAGAPGFGVPPLPVVDGGDSAGDVASAEIEIAADGDRGNEAALVEDEEQTLGSFFDAPDAAGVGDEEAHGMIDRATNPDGGIDLHIVTEMIDASKQKEGNIGKRAAVTEMIDDANKQQEDRTAKRATVLSIEHVSKTCDANESNGTAHATAHAAAAADDEVEEVEKVDDDGNSNETQEHATAEISMMKAVDVLSADVDAEVSLGAFERGLRKLVSNLAKGPRPTLFHVVQVLGGSGHRVVLDEQREVAAVFTEDPIWGATLTELEHKEIKSSMRQQLAAEESLLLQALRKKSRFSNFGTVLDEDVLPALMCAISKGAIQGFQEALLASVKGAKLYAEHRKEQGESDGSGDGGGEDNADDDDNDEKESVDIKLKVGPIKRSNRIAVKVADYRKEKGEENWPHSQFVTDILRASYICASAKDMVAVFRSLQEAECFQVVRLKNKIGRCEPPYNLHMNLLFHPKELEDPILCEVQLFPSEVYELQHRQHLLYELKRAPSVTNV